MTRVSPKSAQVKQYQIKPLSLHKRSYSTNDTTVQTFVNKLTISGNFTLNEAHTWLQLCLPEIPERITSSSASQLAFSFMSTFTDTILTCTCNKGSLTFLADNVSTISILKDFITREATKKLIPLEMSLNINELSIGHTLRKLYPKLKALLGQRYQAGLLEGVKELETSDPQIAAELRKQFVGIEAGMDLSLNLERLYGLLTDLYIDYHKLKGGTRAVLANVKNKIDDLVALIENYATEEYNESIFIDKLNQFWGIQQTAN